MTTTTADNVTPGVEPTPEQTRRGRRTALLLFAVGFGPMVLATIMFYTGWLNPAGHSNQGQLHCQTSPRLEHICLLTIHGQRCCPTAASARTLAIFRAA